MKAFNTTILSTALVLCALPGYAQAQSTDDTTPPPAQQGRWRRAADPPPITAQTPDDQPGAAQNQPAQAPMQNGDNGSVVSAPDGQQPPDNGQAPPPQGSPDNGGWQNSPPPPPANGAPPQSNDPWGRFGASRGATMGGGYNQAPPQQQPQPPSSMTIPAGTWVTIRVNEPLSSDHNQQGDPFMGTLAEPLVVNGLVLGRRGQMISGRVSEAVKAGHGAGTSRLGLELTEIAIADGQQINVHTQMIQRRGPSSAGRDAAAIGTTTAVGAAIGAGAAGGIGAGLGAIAGAGASSIGVLLTRGRPTVIYPEQALTFQLVNPVTVTADFTNQAFAPVSQQDYQQNGLRYRSPAPYGYSSGYGYPYAYAPYPYYYGGYYPYWGWGGYWGPSVFIGGGFYGRGFYGGGFRGSFRGGYHR